MTSPSLEQYLANRLLAQQTTLACAKPVLMKSLKDAGITEVKVTYDGEGDSGQISDVTAIDAFGNVIDLSGSQHIDVRVNDKIHTHDSLGEFLEDYCWDLLGLHHDGFEINDGGFGIFTITVATGSISLERNDRFVDCTTSIVEV